MGLCINQSEEYLGHDRWRWSVWLGGTTEQLDSVDQVLYILHPTFNNPVRESRDRASNFRLEAIGWGAFTVYAKVIHRDGHETTLEHDLVLLYPDGTPTLA